MVALEAADELDPRRVGALPLAHIQRTTSADPHGFGRAGVNAPRAAQAAARTPRRALRARSRRPDTQRAAARGRRRGGRPRAFGDGIRGARVPTGKSNVRATYRFGAGGDPIPAGSVTQIVRGAPGLVRVHNPAPLTGGSDREGPKQLRKSGPASARILGRLVGLPDFGARAQSFSGVLQSTVERTWDEQTQGAVAKVWFIPKNAGGDAQLAIDLRSDLEALSEEGTIVEAARAARIEQRLRIVVVHDPAYRGEDVEAAVHALLTEEEEGLLALANARIGGALPRKGGELAYERISHAC